jgi:hypothetical protein
MHTSKKVKIEMLFTMNFYVAISILPIYLCNK